jgi:hypothetical protein
VQARINFVKGGRADLLDTGGLSESLRRVMSLKEDGHKQAFSAVASPSLRLNHVPQSLKIQNKIIS